MTSRITDLLSELDALAEKATPGPWLFDVPAPPPAERLDNATFLVELRNAYPLLRAEILRLREALEIRAGEVAWLVEISDGASPQYLTLQHEPLSKWPPPTWSPDPNKALRFARKEDAERWSCAFRLDDELVGAKAVEHMWISP